MNNIAAGLALAVPTIFIWGVTFVSTKALLVDFSALEVLWIRYFMAYAALWALRPRRLRLGSRREELGFALAGLSGVALYQFLENAAIHFTNASNVSILVSICPMMTAAMAQWVFRERAVTRRFVLGFLLAIAGVTLVCMNGVTEFHLNPAGDAMALCAAVCWACYSTLLPRLNGRGYDFLVVTRRIFFWALVFMLPMIAAGGVLPDSAMGGSLAVDFSAAANAARFSRFLNWTNLCFLGLFASAGCFVAWNKACMLLGTVRATVGIYLLPVITVVFAYLFLGERLSAMGAFGAVLTLGGVILSERR